jgi:hypothetical protein
MRLPATGAVAISTFSGSALGFSRLQCLVSCGGGLRAEVTNTGTFTIGKWPIALAIFIHFLPAALTPCQWSFPVLLDAAEQHCTRAVADIEHGLRLSRAFHLLS